MGDGNSIFDLVNCLVSVCCYGWLKPCVGGFVRNCGKKFLDYGSGITEHRVWKQSKSENINIYI